MPKYYLLDENKNLVEGFDKEGFLALLEQAIEEGSLENIDENSAVASKIKSLLNGTTHNIEFVTEAQYNQLEAEGKLVANTYYFITDDTSLEGFEDALNNLVDSLRSLTNRVDNLGLYKHEIVWSGGSTTQYSYRLWERRIIIYNSRKEPYTLNDLPPDGYYLGGGYYKEGSSSLSASPTHIYSNIRIYGNGETMEYVDFDVSNNTATIEETDPRESQGFGDLVTKISVQ